MCVECSGRTASACRQCRSLKSPKLTNCFAPLRFCEKQRVKKLLEYRIVKDSLLYVIGVPKAYADVDLLRSKNFYGQFGSVQRIVINHNPKKEND
jgi:hypothetical protein